MKGADLFSYRSISGSERREENLQKLVIKKHTFGYGEKTHSRKHSVFSPLRKNLRKTEQPKLERCDTSRNFPLNTHDIFPSQMSGKKLRNYLYWICSFKKRKNIYISIWKRTLTSSLFMYKFILAGGSEADVLHVTSNVSPTM